MVNTSDNQEKHCSLITKAQPSHCPLIVFLPYEEGGIYINLQHATVRFSGGCGRIEFELDEREIVDLIVSDPESPVYGDEADLVYPHAEPNFPEYINSLPLVTLDPSVSSEWRYWCEVDENGRVMMQW